MEGTNEINLTLLTDYENLDLDKTNKIANVFHILKTVIFFNFSHF